LRQRLVNMLKRLRSAIDVVIGRPQSCYVGQGRVLARVHGFRLLLPGHDVGITPSLVLNGVFELSTRRVMLPRIRPGMRVIDVGAHVGYFTVQMAAAVGPTGKVTAFEALPSNAWFLKRNVELAGQQGWVTVVEKALWNESGVKQLRTHADHTGGNSLVGGDVANTPEEGFIDVPTTTLDEALGDDLRVDLIKIDAEAAEPFILEGMAKTLAANPKLTLLMEFSPLFVDSIGRDHREYLKSLRDDLGFAVAVVEPSGKMRRLDFADVGTSLNGVSFPCMLLLERG